MTFFTCNIKFIVCEVSNHLVDAINTDGREVVSQCAEIALSEREKTLIHVLLHFFALDLKTCFSKTHKVIKTLVETFFVALEDITETSAVDCYNANRTSLFGRTEESVATFEKFSQVQLKPTAHRANLIGFKLGIDEVLEVRQAVLCSHLEKKL